MTHNKTYNLQCDCCKKQFPSVYSAVFIKTLIKKSPETIALIRKQLLSENLILTFCLPQKEPNHYAITCKECDDGWSRSHLMHSGVVPGFTDSPTANK